MDPIIPLKASVIAAQLGGPAKIGTEIDSALDPVCAVESGIRTEAAGPGPASSG